MQTFKPVRWSESLDYSFATGRLRALEVLLLDRTRYERLSRAVNVQEFFAILSETRYGQLLEAGDADNPALLFRRVQDENLRFCLQYAADEWLRQLLQLPVEMFNLKVALKKRLVPDAYGVEEWQLPALGWVRKEKWHRVAALIIQGAEEAFAQVRAQNDPALIDVVLDRIEQEVALTLTTGQDYAHNFYRLYADLANVQMVVRLRLLGEDEGVLDSGFLPGGSLPKKFLSPLVKLDDEGLLSALSSTPYHQLVRLGLKGIAEKGSLLPMEHRARETRLEYVNTARYVALGYEPLFRYSQLLDNELTNLRLLYGAKVSGLEPERCQELVVYAF